MAILKSFEKLLSGGAFGRFGLHRFYGRAIYGHSCYGDGEITYHDSKENPLQFCGIYKSLPINGKREFIKQDYYCPANPQTEEQQSNRLKFANAIEAWQNLTDEQKEFYNKESRGKNITGYNLFIHDYLLSN